MELPADLINYIKSFLPPHPLDRKMKAWTRRTYFNRWFFQQQSLINRKSKTDKFIDHNNFWIKMSELNNEEAVKLKHKCYLDKKRMITKLKSLNNPSCKIITHIPRLNKHGNYSEIFYEDKEIVY